MIVKNEEDTLGRCLESVKDLIDEFIIVDTGSSDRTKEIIGQYAPCIYEYKWNDNFAAARNFSFQQATMDFILWLDADDILLEADRIKLKKLKETLALNIDAINMHYHLEHDQNGNVISSLRRNRLVKRVNNFQWYGAVHEYLEVHGNILESDIAITHSSIKHDHNRNLTIYEKRLAKGEEFTPRDLIYYANELFDHQKYEQAITVYQQFLDTKKGWVEDNISACGNLADCFHYLGDKEKEYRYIIKSFEFDTPRAEFCCRLGYFHLLRNKPHLAIFWYKLATNLEKPNKLWGRINHASWTWLPHLMLSYCYLQSGELEHANQHNKLAAQYIPNHPIILTNQKEIDMLLIKKDLANQSKSWKPIAKEVDKKFQLRFGNEKLLITYVMDHMNLCGGVKAVIEQSNYLVRRGHHVTILCKDRQPDWINLEANYIQIPSEKKMTEVIPESDIIITTYWKQILDCYLENKAPIIHFEQGDTYIFEFDQYEQSIQEEWLQHWSVPVPIIAVSSGLAKQVEKNFNRSAQVLHYALNDKVFYPRKLDVKKSVRPHILFVGPEQWSFKGIPIIREAISIVQQRGYDVEPVWVTQFPPETDFNGTLYIRPGQEQLAELYRSCDIYVCASYFESFGLPALEAMTSGCAVISTRNKGVLEYALHGFNCLLTEIEDPEGMADAIIELLENEKLKTNLIKGGYQTAEKFKISAVIERLEHLIYNVIHDWKSQ